VATSCGWKPNISRQSACRLHRVTLADGLWSDERWRREVCAVPNVSKYSTGSILMSRESHQHELHNPDLNHILKQKIRLTLILLTWWIGWAPNDANKWQTRFNSAFKGLIRDELFTCYSIGKWLFVILCPNVPTEGLTRESTSQYKFSWKQRKRFCFLSCDLSTAAGSRSRTRWILMFTDDFPPLTITNVSRFSLNTVQFITTRLHAALSTLYSRHSRDISPRYRLHPHCIWGAYNLILDSWRVLSSGE
jgi:hypothetical protein